MSWILHGSAKCIVFLSLTVNNFYMKEVVLRVPPGLNSLTPTIYGNPMITMFILVIDNQNHIYIRRIFVWG